MTVTTDDLFNLLPPESQKMVLDLVNKDVEKYKKKTERENQNETVLR
ncbi:MAG: hypothetical protein K6C94_09255 [Candidatus Gastranaerophilales bacterium]|nr:hypothetical protein [Candidatus Gastranaerophilales bacterium]